MITKYEHILHLFFKNERLQSAVEKEVSKYRNDFHVVAEAKWKGAIFKNKITSGYIIGHEIKWVSEAVGYGLFTKEELKKGQFVGEYVGEVKRFIPFRFRRNEYIGEYRLSDHFPMRYIIDSEKKSNSTRFINHSDHPNLLSMTVIVDNLLHIIFVATKNIEKGSQLTFNYGEAYWEKRLNRKVKL